jgi:hypothetical protein
MSRGLPDNPSDEAIVKRGEALIKFFESDKEKYPENYVIAVKLAVAAYRQGKVLEGLAKACEGVKSFDDFKDSVKRQYFLSAVHWIGLHSDEVDIMHGKNISRQIEQTHHVFDRLKMALKVTSEYTPVTTAFLMALCFDERYKIGDFQEGQFVFSSEPPELIGSLWPKLGGIVRDPIDLSPIDTKLDYLTASLLDKLTEALFKEPVTKDPLILKPADTHDKINLEVTVKDTQLANDYFRKAIELIGEYHASVEIL